MKRLLFLFGVFLFGSINVSAMSNPYFQNENGVKLTMEEYNFILEFYDEGKLFGMTKEDYDWIAELNISTNGVEINSVEDNVNSLNGILTRGSMHSTSYKKITIAKSCTSSVCTVIVNLVWLQNPAVRSYDVIGARFLNTSLANTNITTKV